MGKLQCIKYFVFNKSYLYYTEHLREWIYKKMAHNKGTVNIRRSITIIVKKVEKSCNLRQVTVLQI